MRLVLMVSRYDEVTRFDLARALAGRGRYWTTAYLVGGLLVDTGCAHSAPDLLAALSETPLTGIVNTHAHEDHIGANGRLQRQRSGLEIRAHPLALPVLAEPRRRQRLHLYRRIMWGWPESSQGRPIADGEMIEAGRRRLQALYMPGHSPDHICLFEPDRGWLFTGDLFVGGRDRVSRADYDMSEIIASLKRAAALPATRLFPGSARVRDDPAEALGAKIAHLEELRERARALRRQGRSVGEIARALCGGPMLIEAITLGHFSRRQLVRSLLAAGQQADRRGTPAG